MQGVDSHSWLGNAAILQRVGNPSSFACLPQPRNSQETANILIQHSNLVRIDVDNPPAVVPHLLLDMESPAKKGKRAVCESCAWSAYRRQMATRQGQQRIHGNTYSCEVFQRLWCILAAKQRSPLGMEHAPLQVKIQQGLQSRARANA